MLVSEVMLQQTQATRVAEAYPRFLARFPTAGTLAQASAADVLRAWGTLGYNRRALALWRACRSITADGFPSGVAELERLPGVGPYTARAVASFAFGRDVGAVDANVRRVRERACALDHPSEVQGAADRLVPRGRSAAWNQAIIDLGATVCRARSPACESCPLRGWCAFASGRRVDRPRRRAAPAFETTSRYVRGRIVAELRRTRGGLATSVLCDRVGVGPERFSAALSSLEGDGVVTVRCERVSLG